MYETVLKNGDTYSVMKCVPGDIIRGAGARAPQFIVTKITNCFVFARDAYGGNHRFRHGLPWHKVKTGTHRKN